MKKKELSVEEYEKLICDQESFNIGCEFIRELIIKEEALRWQLSGNLDLYESKGMKRLYKSTFSQWNKSNLVIWDLKDILCRMGIDVD